MDEKARDFLNTIIEIANRLPASELHSVSESIESLRTYSAPNESCSLPATVSHPANRDRTREMLRQWRKDFSDLSSQAVAWALRTAGEASAISPLSQRIQVVWSGPVSKGCTLRRTEQVLLDLIRNASKSLLIVSFVVYKIPTIAEALRSAVERGVEITLVLESPEESEGKMDIQIIKGIGKSLIEQSHVYTWPLEKRLKTEDGQHGSLHVKCAVADEQFAFISSANLTEYALNLNMELGVLLEDSTVSRTIRGIFTSLIDDGILRKATA